MKAKDLSKIEIVKGIKHGWGENHKFSWNQKMVVGREDQRSYTSFEEH